MKLIKDIITDPICVFTIACIAMVTVACVLAEIDHWKALGGM